MLQHLRGVHVLPPAIADIYGTDFFVMGHQLYPVREATIPPAMDGLCLFQIGEDLRRANEQTGINRIVIPKIFANASHLVSARLNLHRVIQIDNQMELAIYGDVKQTRVKVIKQAIDDRVIENMVAHREEKWCADVTCCCEKRDAILFLPFAIQDE